MSDRRASVFEDSGDTLRQVGREFLGVLYAAARSLKLYPAENDQVQKAVAELETRAEQLIESEGQLELQLQGEFLFINDTRLRLELENYSAFSHVLSLMRACGIGHLTVAPGVTRKEWVSSLSLINRFSEGEESPEKFLELQQRMAGVGVEHITIEPPLDSDEQLEDEEKRKEAAKRTYSRSVSVTREVTNSIRMGRSANLKRVKRAVQSIVDQVLTDEVSILGLTTISDYDDYTFTHSVNVCIFSIALGRKLGLNRLQLYDLGLAALMHDVGKSRIPLDILNKPGGLTDEEWSTMQDHPWMGVLTLFNLRGFGQVPYRAMVVAHEHHMKRDLTGYPKTVRQRKLSVYSKLVAIADGFDAATTRRSYQSVPLQPDEVLHEMWTNPKRGYETVLVKAFINLLGVYPVGTCVILDSYEVALVHQASKNQQAINRPVVRLVLSAEGVPFEPAPLVDLAVADPDGSYPRSIIKVTDPAKYGINIGDYFV